MVRARPNDDNSPNGITLCVRGAYGYDYIYSPERLTSPLIKVDGEFQPVSWEEALDIVANKFGKIKATHGPDSLAVLGSSKCTNEENYLLQKFARAVLGTNNIDNGGHLYNAASRAGLGEAFGFPASTNLIDDMEQSGVILLIGADPAVSAPLVSYAIKRAVKYKGAKLLLVNPQQTKLNALAHLWLCPKAGTEAVLIDGLMRIIINEELWDQDFVARKTDIFEVLVASLQGYTPDYVEEITGVPTQDLHDAARLFAGANSASIVYGDGIAPHFNGTQAVTALANLAMLTGNIGRKGRGIYALQKENNGQGASDMGCLPDFLPGYQSAENAGLTALEMVEQAKAGKVKGMYIMGENPAASFPDSALTEEALSSLDFLIVQDLFLTETAKMADVILPAASFAEKEGTFTNFERRVQRVRQAIEPLGESLPDWQIIQRLANKMGYSMSYSSPQEIMDEIRELVPLYQGVDYADMEVGGVYWPKSKIDRWGTRRLYEGGFPQGSGRFSAVEHQPQVEMPEEVGAQGHAPLLYQFGSGARSSRSARLKAMMDVDSPPFEGEVREGRSKTSNELEG